MMRRRCGPRISMLPSLNGANVENLVWVRSLCQPAHHFEHDGAATVVQAFASSDCWPGRKVGDGRDGIAGKCEGCNVSGVAWPGMRKSSCLCAWPCASCGAMCASRCR